MNEIKSIIAKNIAELRQAVGMTQLELAERLNYSDKAVSKWERGESIPDVSVLVEIARLFDVTLDYLVCAEHPVTPARTEAENPPPPKPSLRKSIVTLLSILLLWLVAVVVFVTLSMPSLGLRHEWLAFIYAIPLSFVLWLIFNSLWFNRRLNYLIISFLVWTTLLAVYLTVLVVGANAWMIFLPGIPGQLILILCPLLRRPVKTSAESAAHQ